MKKRLFGILLSLTLMIGMIPAFSWTVFADVAETWDSDVNVDTSRSIGGDVEVTNDIALTIAPNQTLTVNGTITLDNKSTLTVTGGGNLVVEGEHKSAIYTDSEGTLKVEDADVRAFAGVGLTPLDGINANVIVIKGTVLGVGQEGKQMGDSGAGIRGAIETTGTLQLSEDGETWEPAFGILQQDQYMKVEGSEMVHYPLWVDGIQVTDQNKDNVLNDGKVSYAPDNNKLTLNGATITRGHQGSDGFQDRNIGIHYYGAETLSVDLADDSVNTVNNDGFTEGIYSEIAGVSISGGGKLTTSGMFAGINTDAGDISISSGTVNASGTGLESPWGNTAYGIAANTYNGEGGNVIISGGIVKASSKGEGAAISADNGTVTISGGTVNAEADGQDQESSGISAYIINITGGKVIAIGNDVGISGTVKNTITGRGWEAPDDTGKGTLIGASTDGQSLPDYKKVQFPTSYNITVTEAEHGSVTAKVGETVVTKADETDTVTLSVTPESGYKLKELTVTRPKDIKLVSDMADLMGDAVFLNSDQGALEVHPVL